MKVDSKRVLNNLRNLQKIKLEDWAFECAGELLRVSNYMVPFKDGFLSQSGGTDRTTRGAITFYDTEYAKRQHEINYNHTNGRSWKYLERPLLQNINKWKSLQKNGMYSQIKSNIN
jgi:hypothetical protein